MRGGTAYTLQGEIHVLSSGTIPIPLFHARSDLLFLVVSMGKERVVCGPAHAGMISLAARAEGLARGNGHQGQLFTAMQHGGIVCARDDAVRLFVAQQQAQRDARELADRIMAGGTAEERPAPASCASISSLSSGHTSPEDDALFDLPLALRAASTTAELSAAHAQLLLQLGRQVELRRAQLVGDQDTVHDSAQSTSPRL